jgi:hypothetical protein
VTNNGSFAPTSRYYKTAVNTYIDASGTAHSYVARRFLPPSTSFALVQEYTVIQGDRIDNLSAHFLGDPEQFWKLCDANDAMEPEALMEIGHTLRITLPEGIPAPTGSSGAK